jgi:hypothetical protein
MAIQNALVESGFSWTAGWHRLGCGDTVKTDYPTTADGGVSHENVLGEIFYVDFLSDGGGWLQC